MSIIVDGLVIRNPDDVRLLYFDSHADFLHIILIWPVFGTP